nr:hypothetical protein [Tanacetum cinerariifolium]
FRSPKMVLRVEKKWYVIEQLIPLALFANSTAQVLAQWNVVYDAHNEVDSLMLEKEGKLVGPYVIKMKNYVAQLKRLSYVLPQDLSVGLILNGLTSNFVGFIRNYNMHNMEKTIGKLHALLIKYEKGLPKKAATPQVMAIQGGRIQKANKKLLNPKGKEQPAKDDAYHNYKEVRHWKRNCLVYLAELIKKKKQVGTASSSGIFTIELFTFPYKSWVYDTGCGTHICNTKQGLRGARKLKQGALYLFVGNGVHAQVEAIGSYDLVIASGLVIYLDNCHYAPSITRGYPKETMGYYFYFPTKNKIIVVRYAKFLEKNLISQEVSGRAEELKKIQDKDTSPSKNTSEILMDVECFEPPQEEVVPVRRSVRTHRAAGRLCLNVEVGEHSLGDLNEPTNYKASLLDPVSNKWLDAMNVEMQSMKDNQVWCLVDLPPNCKTVGSKWLFKKKNDMDGIVHTIKLVW